MSSPRVAGANSFCCEPAAFYCTVLLYRFYSVLRTGGFKPACISYKRGQSYLIKFDKAN